MSPVFPTWGVSNYRMQWTAQGSVFGTVCDLFVCVWNISGSVEWTCAKFTRKTWLVPRSDQFEGQGQRSKTPGTKNGIFRQYIRNCWTDLCQTDTEDVFGPLLRRVWRSRSRSILAACVWFILGKDIFALVLSFLQHRDIGSSMTGRTSGPQQTVPFILEHSLPRVGEEKWVGLGSKFSPGKWPIKRSWWQWMVVLVRRQERHRVRKDSLPLEEETAIELAKLRTQTRSWSTTAIQTPAKSAVGGASSQQVAALVGVN